jgi:hypoxanthine phosphoribosyltransferase
MIRIHDLQFEIMIGEAELLGRVKAIGETLNAELKGQNPRFISILSGAFVFAADLIRYFDGPCEIGFVKLSSYSGTQSSGAVHSIMGPQDDLAGRHIVVIEDIVDTGRTLHYFLAQLQAQQPASIRTVALLRKPEALQFNVPVEHVGYDIEDRFVVGYGLDYEGQGRNLRGIYCLSSS